MSNEMALDINAGGSLPSEEIMRRDFPKDFIFGTGSSAYQIEGAWREGGKGLSVWDTFCLRNPVYSVTGKIADRGNACKTTESYFKMKEDVQMLKKMGVRSFRFSISWSRILPGGKVSMGKSMEGINYYNQLIDELLANDIEPFITIFHWDLPNALEEEYMGFLSSKIVDDFVNYADICFWEFGDRVKNWVTLNEPYRFMFNGYVNGYYPPGRGGEDEEGDPATEPYLVAYNLLCCHAETCRNYQANYKECQGGKIGISLDTYYFKPYRGEDNQQDVKAVQYAFDFMLGLFMEPLTTGTWPRNVQEFAVTPTDKYPRGRTLPNFGDNGLASKLIGSYDFLGINYYTANYAQYQAPSDSIPQGFITDSHYRTSGSDPNNNLIGEPAFAGSTNLIYLCPEQLTELLLYTKKKYNVNGPIIITENGAPEYNDPPKTYLEVRRDTFRLRYIKYHLKAIKAARGNGVNVMGYFVWSYMDSFEWSSGYRYRFGMIYVDYEQELQRYPKQSAIWYKNFLKDDCKIYHKRNITDGEEGTEKEGESSKAARAVEVTQKLKKAKS